MAFLPPRGDWKSAAAENLRRIGREDTAKALYGIKDKSKPEHQIDERQAREWRKEAKRQARRNTRPTSFRERLRRFFRWLI